MKKINIYLYSMIIILLIVSVKNGIAEATINSMGVRSMNASSMFKTAMPGGGIVYKFPGVVRAVGGSAPLITEVAENVIMALPAARGARIIEAIAMIGLTYMGYEGLDYLHNQLGLSDNGNNFLVTGPNYAAVPTNCVLSPQCGTYVGNFTDGEAAMNAVESGALAAGLTSGQATSNWHAQMCQKPDGSWYGGFWTSYYTPYFCSTVITSPVYPVQTNPLTTNNIAPNIENDLNNPNAPGHQAAVDALIETLNRVNKALLDLTDTLNHQKPTINNVIDELNQSIPNTAADAAKQDIEIFENTGATTQTTYDNVYNNPTTNNTTNNSTVNNYNTTNNTTNNNAPTIDPLTSYTGGNTIGLTAYQKPTVDNFPELFTNFLYAMKDTPLFSLPGLLSSSIPSGGSCSYQVNMSERFGGVHTVSICGWATGLSYMKAVLLCMASIFAVGIIVKGGGG